MPKAAKGRPSRGTGREALLRAAVAVVGEHGLENATMRRIAAWAGVDNTLITHYFGSRDALLTEAAEWVFDEQLRVAEVSVDFLLDPDARAALIKTVDEEPILQLFLYEMTLAAPRHPELRARISRLYDEYVTKMQESLRARGLPADEPLARAVFAMVDGLVLQQVAVASPEQIDAAFVRFGELLEALLLPRT